MIVAIHQPNFLPWLGYFYKMAVADRFVFLDTVAFSKGSYTNRVQIKTQKGASWLTVPVQTSGKLGQDISDVLCEANPSWRRKVIGNLKNSYRLCPYFKTYSADLFSIISGSEVRLADLNIQLIQYLAEQLSIATPTVRSSTMISRGKATELLIALCGELGADTYLSGSGGANYQDEQAFAAAGIQVTYAGYQHPQYPQPPGEFVPGLSALDLLFNCGAEASAVLRTGGPKEAV